MERSQAEISGALLVSDISSALSHAGYETEIDPQGSFVIAHKNLCRMLIRNGDKATELKSVFQLAAAAYGPVSIGYRGIWNAGPPPIRSAFERKAQDGLAMVGLPFERPAVIALAQSPDCADVHAILNAIRVRPS